MLEKMLLLFVFFVLFCCFLIFSGDLYKCYIYDISRDSKFTTTTAITPLHDARTSHSLSAFNTTSVALPANNTIPQTQTIVKITISNKLVHRSHISYLSSVKQLILHSNTLVLCQPHSNCTIPVIFNYNISSSLDDASNVQLSLHSLYSSLLAFNPVDNKQQLRQVLLYNALDKLIEITLYAPFAIVNFLPSKFLYAIQIL